MTETAPLVSAEPERMTPEELKTLARRVVKREVFIANDMPGFESFYLLLSLPVQGYTRAAWRDYLDHVGAIWEDRKLADTELPSGAPSFASGHFVHDDDMPELIATIGRLRELTR